MTFGLNAYKRSFADKEQRAKYNKGYDRIFKKKKPKKNTKIK
jgi:hypothetical protein